MGGLVRGALLKYDIMSVLKMMVKNGSLPNGRDETQNMPRSQWRGNLFGDLLLME